MDNVSRYIFIALTIFILGLMRYGYKAKPKSNSNIIKQPLMILRGGIFVSIIFVILGISMPFLPTTGGVEILVMFFVLSILMTLFGITFIWYYIVWEIRIGDHEFIYRSMFGKSIQYEYTECKCVVTPARIDIYVDKKCILKISALSENWYELSNRIEPYMEKYQNE
ncbi:DUF6560 family protein [Paracholeplasma brassicae]|nr:DUF6560 family protein [Paracholeplasma brassicae]